MIVKRFLGVPVPYFSPLLPPHSLSAGGGPSGPVQSLPGPSGPSSPVRPGRAGPMNSLAQTNTNWEKPRGSMPEWADSFVETFGAKNYKLEKPCGSVPE